IKQRLRGHPRSYENGGTADDLGIGVHDLPGIHELRESIQRPASVVVTAFLELIHRDIRGSRLLSCSQVITCPAEATYGRHGSEADSTRRRESEDRRYYPGMPAFFPSFIHSWTWASLP